MNKHTLNYHTRLHDWYRQHSILQEKHQQQVSQQDAALKQAAVDSGAATLTQDKLHFINDWCSDVNKALFKVKRKESPPLFRRCRMSAKSSNGGISKSADPRRIRSAEVFTLSGNWAKQPKAIVNGGELLPNNRVKSGKDGRRNDQNESASCKQEFGVPGSKDNQNHLDLCVRNSKEGDEHGVLPRVNHDSLNLRANAFVLKQNGGRPTERIVSSPRNSISTTDKGSSHLNKQSSALRRVKSAAPSAVNRQHDRLNESYVIYNNRDSRSRNQKETELMKNAKNEEYSRQAFTRPSSHKSHLTSKTDDTFPETDDEGRLARPIIDVVVKDEVQQIVPTFCSKCSGIYSEDSRPPSAPKACGDCIHGISIGTETHADLDKDAQALQELQMAEKRIADYGKKVEAKLTQTVIEVKKVESRLTEDSIHYSSERGHLRDGHKKPGFALPNPFDDLEDERNISFDDEGNDINDDSDDDRHGSECSDVSRHSEDNGGAKNDDGGKENKKRGARVTIVTEDLTQDNDEADERDDSDDEAPDPNLLRKYRESRGDRRKSISFTYKPTIGSISTSNSLLHVLSIDDCKVNMRYSPHKVLEEHEVTDNIMVPLSFLNTNTFSSDKEGETTSKVAMRVSKDSSSNTSLQSSTINDATRINKKRYKILYDPEDLDFYKNKRPSSIYLAKAFHTLIHDRTIMQRLDQANNTGNTKSTWTVSRAREGPTYRRINAALKRHMGDVLQGHCVQMRSKYERLKSGSTRGKTKKNPSLTSQSPSLSLSLESLPVVRKGILKHANTGNEEHNSLESLTKPPEN